jgi:hypothetical protein
LVRFCRVPRLVYDLVTELHIGAAFATVYSHQGYHAKQSYRYHGCSPRQIIAAA